MRALDSSLEISTFLENVRIRLNEVEAPSIKSNAAVHTHDSNLNYIIDNIEK